MVKEKAMAQPLVKREDLEASESASLLASG